MGKRSKSNSYPANTLVKIDGVHTREDTQFYLGKRVVRLQVQKGGEEFQVPCHLGQGSTSPWKFWCCPSQVPQEYAASCVRCPLPHHVVPQQHLRWHIPGCQHG